jgi:hypothetical protein
LEWGFNFSGEIGNLDGITALEVTDVGVIPEPGCGLLVVAGVSFIPGRCHRRRRLGVV